MAGRHGDLVVLEIPTLHDTKCQRIQLPKFDRHWTNIKPHCAGSNEGSVSFWLKFRWGQALRFIVGQFAEPEAPRGIPSSVMAQIAARRASGELPPDESEAAEMGGA
jgi:hypothetical protein